MSEDLKAIIFTERNQVRDASRTALKESGIESDKMSFPTKAKDCIGLLKERNKTILIIDWELGVAEALEVLTAIRDTHQRDTVATFLIAATMSEKIIAAGAEFGASQIHTGDITKDKVKVVIGKLISEMQNLSPVKQLLSSVAEFRLKGNWEHATSILEQLHTKEPNLMRVRLELAENYIFEKKWDKAFELLKGAKERQPPEARELHLLGKCFLKQGKELEAVQVFKEAKMINPFNIDRLMELGNALLKIDKTKEASENFDEVIAIAPKHTTAKQGKGACMLIDGEVNEALALLKDSITGIELASVFNTAAVLTMRQGRIPQGMDLYEAAATALAKQQDVLARIYYNKGIGYFRWKKLDEAKQCFEKATQLDPKFENAQHNLRAMTGAKKSAAPGPAPAAATPAPSAAPTTAAAPASAPLPAADAPAPVIPTGGPLAAITFDDGLNDPFSNDLSDEDERL